MSILASPLRLPCGVSIPNRLAKAAMTEGLADPQLQATPQHARLYQRWAESGVGLSLTGNVQIDRRVLERPGNVAIEDESGMAGLRQWAAAGTAGGGQLWMQISHAGRQSFKYITRQPLGPSAVPVAMLGQIATPRALEEAEILDFIQRFAQVARIAKAAGFTGVQVHAAHGYLLSSFLSPLANRRTDRWGGSLENRARFLLETVRAVRAQVGASFPVAVKLNSADFQRGGFDHTDSLAVLKLLNNEGLDLLEISGGNYEQPKLLGFTDDKTADAAQVARTREREAYFLRYAEEVKEVAQMPLMVTGGFRSREVMEAAINSGACQMVGLGRPFCVASDFIKPLLGGASDRVPNPEAAAAQARSWWSAASPIKAIKLTHVMGMQGYYYRQIIRMANGLPVEPEPRVLRCLLWHLNNEYRTAWAMKRARRAG